MVAKLSNNHTFKLRELNYNKISRDRFRNDTVLLFI